MRQTPRSSTQDRPDLPLPVQTVIAGAAQDLFSRLLNRYLPDDDKGFAYDDQLKEAAPPPQVDPYQVLGLPPGASAVEVKRRLRQLARVFHPDVEGGYAAKMAEINDAADQLLRRTEPAGAG